MYHIPETSQILILCWGGEVLTTKDNGVSFSMELSKQTNPINTGWGIIAEDKVRLWEAGADISYLDIPYNAEKVKRIESLNGNTISFGTVDAGQDKTIDVVIANTGNTSLSISAVAITNENGTEDETFISNGEYPIQLEVNAQARIPVTFAPKSDGSKQAELVVNSDADAGALKIALNGTGSTVGVSEVNNIPGFYIESINPNPVQDKCNLIIKSDRQRNISIKIYGLTGKDYGTRVLTGIGAGSARFELNTADLPAGVYNLIINVDGISIPMMFIKY
jgi:methanogen extracellular protein (TIGR04279 family)